MSDFDIYRVADPFSVAVREGTIFPGPFPDYEYQYNEDPDIDDPFGIKFLTAQQDQLAAGYSSHPVIEELDCMKNELKTVVQQHEYLMSYKQGEIERCLHTYESMVASFQSRLDEMTQTNFNEIAWHSFATILKHRSALYKRRYERHPIQKAARKTAIQTQFGGFQAKWRQFYAWADVVSKFLPVSRRSTRQEQLRRFNVKWKCLIAWADASSKLLPASRQSTWQGRLSRFQVKWGRLISWADTAFKLLSVSRQSTWQGQSRRFQAKWKHVFAWAKTASKLLPISRQSTWQGQSRRFQAKWKHVFAWAKTASKLLPVSRHSELQRELKKLQQKWNRQDIWSNFAMYYSSNSNLNSVKTEWKTAKDEIKAYSIAIISKWTQKTSKVTYASGSARVKKWKFIAFWSMLVNKAKTEQHATARSLVKWAAIVRKDLRTNTKKLQIAWSNTILAIGKERRSTKRLMVQLNHQDHVVAVIRNWKHILDDKDAINTLIFNKVYLIQRWCHFYLSLVMFSKYSVQSHIELSSDTKRIFRIFCTDFGHEREQDRERFNSEFKKTYGKWPLYWQTMKEKTIRVYSNLNCGLRMRLKKLNMEIFRLVSSYLRINQDDKTFECRNSDQMYLDAVQFMFDEIFLGCVQIDWDKLSFQFHILKAIMVPDHTISFFMNMNSVANIVGFYYLHCADLMKLYKTYVPEIISKLSATKIPPSEQIVKNLMRTLTVNFQARFVNRFEITLDSSIPIGINVIIKCRMVRKVDGKVSSEGKKCECGLLEALEQFYRGTFDDMMGEILGLERRMKIMHRYGRLLEHWDGSN